MRRVSVLILLLVTFALGLDAQSKGKPGKIDKQLQNKSKQGKPSDVVPVIIRTHDLSSLPAKLGKSSAKNVKGFATFPGMSAELTLAEVQNYLNDPTIDGISFDERVTGASITGTEAPTSSSGAAAA